jgi:hypothetical protein
MRRMLIPAAMALAALALLTFAPAAGADDVMIDLTVDPPAHSCPPSPPPGSTISGGLLVNGPCVLDHVSVSGGVLVTSTGGLELENSSVSGGITVQQGGELDAGHVLDSATATFNPNSISGGIKYTNGFDLDLDGATISGGVSINGSGNEPTICKSSLGSDLRLSNFASGAPFWIGDPGEPIFASVPADCPGNTIGGSLYVTNSQLVEIEANLIKGSVFLTSSSVDFEGNTVQGSASCTSDTPFADDVPAPNTVHGSSNCP